jgi:hypothetical protein
MWQWIGLSICCIELGPCGCRDVTMWTLHPNQRFKMGAVCGRQLGQRFPHEKLI